MDHQCEHKGCTSEDTIRCVSFDYDMGEDIDYYYCGDHVTDHGFCWMCGQFWAGVDAFDFDPGGLCPNCRDDVDAENCEDDPFIWEGGF